MTVTLPMPMSLWRAYEGQGRQRHKTKEYQAYQDSCFWQLKAQKFALENSSYKSVEIYFYSPKWFTKKKKLAKIDLENRLKCLLDTIVKYCEINKIDFDDSHIIELYCAKVPSGEEKALVTFKNVVVGI